MVDLDCMDYPYV
jgi:uncharacterized membrane protein YfcA